MRSLVSKVAFKLPPIGHGYDERLREILCSQPSLSLSLLRLPCLLRCFGVCLRLRRRGGGLLLLSLLFALSRLDFHTLTLLFLLPLALLGLLLTFATGLVVVLARRHGWWVRGRASNGPAS